MTASPSARPQRGDDCASDRRWIGRAGILPPVVFGPGQWQPTPSCPVAGGTNYHWQHVTPFALPNVEGFRRREATAAHERRICEGLRRSEGRRRERQRRTTAGPNRRGAILRGRALAGRMGKPRGRADRLRIGMQSSRGQRPRVCADQHGAERCCRCSIRGKVLLHGMEA